METFEHLETRLVLSNEGLLSLEAIQALEHVFQRAERPKWPDCHRSRITMEATRSELHGLSTAKMGSDLKPMVLSPHSDGLSQTKLKGVDVSHREANDRIRGTLLGLCRNRFRSPEGMLFLEIAEDLRGALAQIKEILVDLAEAADPCPA